MSFEDIKGQDSAIGLLKQSLARGLVFSNYLFVGPDGIGKKATARIFAKAVNCLNKKDDACEECISCKKIESGVHPDIFRVGPEGASATIGIDAIREIIARANLKPYEGKNKVFIIDEAHSMNAEASNAFLKTLEEPPKDTIFILISRSKELLLSTIVSRSHVVSFIAAAPELVADVLVKKFDTEKDKARILSIFSSGRIGKAVEMKEKNLIERKNALINIAIGGNGDFSDVLGAYSKRDEMKEDLDFLLAYLRDIFICKILKDEKALFNIDRIDEIKRQRGKYSLEELDKLIKKVITLRSYIDYNVNPKTIIGVLGRAVKGRG